MPRSRLRRSHRRDQHGFSLIELTIALLIALFLLGGLVTLVMGTRRNSSTQSGLAQLQDNERIAMTVITNMVQKAGYFPYPMVQQLSTFSAETFNGVTFAQSQAIGGTFNAAAPGDTFAVRFLTPTLDTTASVINCAGQSNSSATNTLWYTNLFQVAIVNGTSWLQCLARSDVAGAASGTVYTINLIPNVTNISVLYGVGSNTGAALGDFSVVQYLNATQVTAANAWQNVTAVKVTLTFLLPQPGATGGQMMPASAPNSTTTFTRVIPIMSRGGVDVT